MTRRCRGWRSAPPAPPIGPVLGNSSATDPVLEATYMPLADEIVARAVSSITVPDGWMEEQDV